MLRSYHTNYIISEYLVNRFNYLNYQLYMSNRVHSRPTQNLPTR